MVRRRCGQRRELACADRDGHILQRAKRRQQRRHRQPVFARNELRAVGGLQQEQRRAAGRQHAGEVVPEVRGHLREFQQSISRETETKEMARVRRTAR